MNPPNEKCGRAFPDLVAAAVEQLPTGLVLDGELLVEGLAGSTDCLMRTLTIHRAGVAVWG
ncbi:hypothetical protein CG719_34415 [Streptomyces sp. CB01373]|nr:hypothetical protein CG719_34415 [Streptomyces sp. CB01373]